MNQIFDLQKFHVVQQLRHESRHKSCSTGFTTEMIITNIQTEATLILIKEKFLKKIILNPKKNITAKFMTRHIHIKPSIKVSQNFQVFLHNQIVLETTSPY